MDAITGLIGLFNHIIDAIELMFFGVIASIVGISILPKDNPLHELLVAFTKHLAATLALAFVALPLQPIPGVDVAYDTASAIFLLWYWGSFAFELMSDSYALRTVLSGDRPGAPRPMPAPKPFHAPSTPPTMRRTPGPTIQARADESFHESGRIQ